MASTGNKSGLLSKKGRVGFLYRPWAERLFYLDRNKKTLEYFKGNNVSRGVLNLNNSSVIRDNTKKNGELCFALHIQEPQFEIVFIKCGNEDELRDWMAAISSAVSASESDSKIVVKNGGGRGEKDKLAGGGGGGRSLSVPVSVVIEAVMDKEVETKLAEAVRLENEREAALKARMVWEKEEAVRKEQQDEEFEQLAKDLRVACKIGDLLRVKEILSILPQGPGGQIDFDDNMFNFTAMHLACKGGHADCLELVLKHGSSSSSKGDYLGFTPTHWACAGGYLKCLTLLLETEASSSSSSSFSSSSSLMRKDCVGRYPINYAAEGAHVTCLAECLSQGADPNASGDDLLTPLFLAAIAGSAECVEILLADERTDVMRKDKKGREVFTLDVVSVGIRDFILMRAQPAIDAAAALMAANVVGAGEEVLLSNDDIPSFDDIPL